MTGLLRRLHLPFTPSTPPARRGPTRRLLAAALAFGVAASGVAAFGACAPAAPSAPPLFERLAPEATGVTFTNTVDERPGFNIINYLYAYNGGGMAVGDVDGNGYQDLYFSANQGPNKLYLNQGNYRFVDATARAGVAGPAGWKTGVTMADVNGDGRPDLFASGVDYQGVHGRNVLYVNSGDGTFTDRTHEYGLDLAGYATQATFFDYDGDGDLDLFLVTHLTDSERSIGNGGRGVGDAQHPRTGGILYRNDPAPNGPGRARHFVDVSAQAGITGSEGFGLGVAVSDVNGDGRPDLYEAIDFQGNDRLYLNNGDGTFAEAITKATGHTSRFSMGVDAADADNDGRPDVFVADMMPEREDVLKTSASSETFNLYNLRLRAGYHPQYGRNTLQRNQGAVRDGPGASVPRFAEVGHLAGVQATDWSWAPLWADLDNDGRKDLFVTNGIYRRPNDLDYINYVGNDAVQAGLARGDSAVNRALLQHMPQIPLANHAFRNDGGLRFTDQAAAWGLAEPGFSNGAAYVDLNNTGALDLVVNRLNAPAAIYRNRARDGAGRGATGGQAANARVPNGQAANNYLTVVLRGDGANTAGVGAKVYVAAGGVTQLVEQQPTRGFLSSVDPRPHVGLGRAARVDSLTVVWPDGRFQLLRGLAPNRTVTLSQADARGRWAYPPDTAASPALFADVSAALGTGARHTENPFLDTDVQPLLPHLLSREGPALAAGDVNGDGLDDLYVGGAKWQPGQLLVQRRDGTFALSPQPALAADSLAEDVDAAFFDADGDGHPDLVVVGGGNEFWGDAEALRPRLYLNDGAGHFRRAADAFPAGVAATASCVVPGDFDGDGRVDLFVGARAVAREYGRVPRSYLLRNDGRGRGSPHFTDVTPTLAPELAQAGMVTGAAWVPAPGRPSAGGRARPDLVVVGEWMPVRVFRQEGGRFVDRTVAAGLAGTEGWWNAVTAADLNGDGRPDLVLGNLGLNSYLTASNNEPARMYVRDFAGNGSLEQVITHYKRGVSYPLAGRDELVRLVPSLRARYPSYASFGASTAEDVFGAAELRQATRFEAHTFATSVALSDGRGGYALRPLPMEAQFAPVRAALAADFDGDGRADLLLAGNDFGSPPALGRYDALRGLLLRGRGDGTFRAVPMPESRLDVGGEVRHLAALRSANGGRLVAVARNDTTLVLLRPLRGEGRLTPAALAAGRR